jgi:hypothetical protein
VAFLLRLRALLRPLRRRAAPLRELRSPLGLGSERGMRGAATARHVTPHEVPRPRRRPGQPVRSGQEGHACVVVGGRRRRRRSRGQGRDLVQAAGRHGDGARGRNLHPPLPQPRSVPARVRIFGLLALFLFFCRSRDECFLGFSILFLFVYQGREKFPSRSM